MPLGKRPGTLPILDNIRNQLGPSKKAVGSNKACITMLCCNIVISCFEGRKPCCRLSTNLPKNFSFSSSNNFVI